MKSYNILPLRAGKSARPILAETILNEERRSVFRTFSAGNLSAGKELFLSLPLESFDELSLASRRREIGKDATTVV